MTEKRPLFRPEAVEHHARGQVGGRRLDLREAVTVWLFRGLLLALALAVAVSFLVRVDTWEDAAVTVGPDGRTATVTLDGEESPGLLNGTVVRIRAGGREVRGHVTGNRTRTVDVALTEPLPAGVAGSALVHGRTSVAALLLGRD